MISFDKLTEEIEGRSWYALLIVIAGLFMNVSTPGILTGSVFLAGIPPSRCYVEPYDNSTQYSQLTDDVITLTFVPWNDVTDEPDRCHRNLINDSWCSSNISVLTCLNSSEVIGKTTCRDGYVYDRKHYDETIVTEWDLVCERHSLISFSTSLFFIGVGIGSVLGGIISDRFGRLFTTRFGLILAIIMGFSTSYSPNIYVFSILRATQVMVFFLSVMSNFTYVSEISPPSWRLAVTLLFNSVFGFGCILFSGFAFYWRKWRDLQRAYTLIMLIPILLYSFLLPKSPRWLFARGSVNQSKKVCEKIAKKSGKTFPHKTWNTMVEDLNLNTKKAPNKKFNTAKELFKRPYSRLLIICNMFVWFVTSLVYYGLALNSGSLAGNPFVNNALGGVMEAVACTAGIYVIRKFGSVKVEVFTLSMAGVACLASTLVVQLADDNYGLHMFGTILALIGRFGVSMCFATIFVHTAEMFPTSGRATAVGLSSMAGRIGTIITPWTIQLQYTIPWLTQTIFGLISLLGVLAAAILVETKDHELMMTFPEAERFYEKKMDGSLSQMIFKLPKRFNEDAEKERLDEQKNDFDASL